MNYGHGGESTPALASEHLLPRVHLTGDPVVWLGVLVVTKLADSITTMVGLALVPAASEANPVVAAAMEPLGVPLALLVMGVASVGCLALVTEGGIRYLRHREGKCPGPETLIRTIGYVPLAVISTVATINNVVIIAGAALGV